MSDKLLLKMLEHFLDLDDCKGGIEGEKSDNS